MKAIVVTKRGGPDVLAMSDVPEPQANAEKGEVLIDVEAVGVNFADTVQTQGMYPNGPRPPYVPGLEFAGRVVASPQAGALAGQRVMGFTPLGAYAPKLVVKKESLFPTPAGWSATEAAAFPVNYFTAWFAYWMAGFIEHGSTPGGAPKPKSVLIHAVAGGVGTASVMMGKILGAEMFGTSSSQEKLDKAKLLGLAHGINYKDVEYEDAIAELTRGRGVDAVFEMLGGEQTATSTRCLANMGRIIIYGMATGQAPQFDFMAMFAKNLSAHALWLTPLTTQEDLMKRAWVQMSEWIKAGNLKPEVGTVLPLEQAAEAHRMLLGRRNYGKVVLTIRT